MKSITTWRQVHEAILCAQIARRLNLSSIAQFMEIEARLLLVEWGSQ